MRCMSVCSACAILGCSSLNLALLAHPESCEELKIDGSASGCSGDGEGGGGVVLWSSYCQATRNDKMPPCPWLSLFGKQGVLVVTVTVTQREDGDGAHVQPLGTFNGRAKNSPRELINSFYHR